MRARSYRRQARMALCAAAVLLPAAPAAACPEVPTTAAFADWGDDSQYAPVAGGTFEELSWATTGPAELIMENNPFSVAGPGASSLWLGSGSTVTSPELCVSRYYPHLRFVARAEQKPELKVEVLYTDDHGRPNVTAVGSEHGDRYPTWGPSKQVKLKKVLPTGEEVRDVHVRFAVKGKGTWLVDDVLIDPAKRG